MKENKFLTYMNLLDDRYIEEADPAASAAPVVTTTRRLRAWRRIPVLAAATVALMALLIVGTFAMFNDWDTYLSLVFKGDVELLDDYTVAAKDVKYTSTNEDVKMEIVGYTGDQNFAYVWVKMALPKTILEQCGKENFDTIGFSEFKLPSCSGEFVGGKLVNDTYIFKLNLCANEFGGGDLTLDGQQVDFSFENIRVFGLDGSEQVIEGLWTASLTLDIPDMSLTLHPSVDGLTFYGDKLDKNEDVEPNKIQANSCMVELSPMSVRLTLTYDHPANVKDAYYDPVDKITLILSDGTRLENDSYGSQTAHDADTSVPGTETAKIMGLFHQAFDPDDIVAIEYAGARIELK